MPEEPKDTPKTQDTPKTPTYEDMLNALGEDKIEFLSDIARLEPEEEQ
jgi:hypothetical protein